MLLIALFKKGSCLLCIVLWEQQNPFGLTLWEITYALTWNFFEKWLVDIETRTSITLTENTLTKHAVQLRDMYLWVQDSRMKNIALVFKMLTKGNYKNCTIFNAMVSIPFVFICVTVGLHLKSHRLATIDTVRVSNRENLGLWACKPPLAKSPVSVIPRLKCW